ncbi:hypothetical protein LIN78_14050 [Leeia sp. TBRC 13508]|uniref:Uncharacterized protein n=1 Tax=Leeia speluncae TaxID=2884804 RepID=A0ABS8D8X1_9NEIS|nr:hypothetical protein [Leeia speluncae]MCB6184666.1 hypothetical protein [Leeia speluncae]
MFKNLKSKRLTISGLIIYKYFCMNIYENFKDYRWILWFSSILAFVALDVVSAVFVFCVGSLFFNCKYNYFVFIVWVLIGCVFVNWHLVFLFVFMFSCFCYSSNKRVSFLFAKLSIFVFLFDDIYAFEQKIPEKNEVVIVDGKYLNSTILINKKNDYGISIVDKNGKIHDCTCKLLGDYNCLRTYASQHIDTIKNLDIELEKQHSADIAMLRWLSGKKGEVWMYPSSQTLRSGYACYQISSRGVVYRSYEQSIVGYMRAKSNVGIYLIIIWSVLDSLYIFYMLFNKLIRVKASSQF